jgi:predicted dehydrogenase
VLSWRFLVDQGGYGVTTDLMSHSVDLAHMLLGPDHARVGTTATFIRERPLPRRRRPPLRARRPEDPTGAVTNEDYAGMLCEFASARAGRSRPAARSSAREPDRVRGLRHQGALGWNLEKLNELQLYLLEDELDTGYRRLRRRPLPLPRHFVPGSANGIGFEDLVVIEDYEFCRSIAEGRPHAPGFARGARVGRASRRRCCSRSQRAAGSRRIAAGGLMETHDARPPPARAHRRDRRRAHRAHARRAARAPGPGRGGRAVFDAHAGAPQRRRRARRAGRGDVEELLGRADVDAVAICTSTDTHADLIVGGRARGKAIFCEKPVSLDLATVDRALAASRRPASRSRSASTAASTRARVRRARGRPRRGRRRRTSCASPAATRRPRR